MRIVLGLLLAMSGCSDPMAPMKGEARWPKTPQEAFSIDDKSCECLVRKRCIRLDLSDGYESWTETDPSSISCVMKDRWRGKASCRVAGGEVIVTRIEGRGWCFASSDAAFNHKSAGWGWWSPR
jgi:hypothetical protein